MSFMFKPLAYDDMKAKNILKLNSDITDEIKTGTRSVVKELFTELSNRESKVVLIDGYVGASFERIVSELKKFPSKDFVFKNVNELFINESELDELLLDYLPLNYDEDPVLLFGYLSEDDFSFFFDEKKITKFKEEINKSEKIFIIYGNGSSYKELRKISDHVVYIDVTPKITAIRAKEAKFKNIGSTKNMSFNLLMRRNYFIDFGVVLKQRQKLIDNNLITTYIIDNNEDEMISLPFSSVKTIFDELSQRPFRAKPVYLEGIWGGEFFRKLRNIPMNIAENIAWIFEFIPMEVSIAVESNGHYLDFPFFTFLQHQKENILGKPAYNKFGGYFPIRFNYDDTWHSDGNMSIQVHPNKKFIQENYNELSSQDEAYYVVATGHGAKTYVGWKENGKDFLALAKKSEKDGSYVDYQKYVYSLNSNVGMQVMIPAGTIHASGQNQVILELGSLTIGSYTYKVYDYNRVDKDNNLRPIHTKNAEQVLEFDRDKKWVHNNIVIEPKLVDEQDSSREFLIGKTNLMYYQAHRIEMQTRGVYEGTNDNQFTVLTLVDGEEAVVYSKKDPSLSFTINYLEIVTVPASISDYVIEAKGYQPIVVHKTTLI